MPMFATISDKLRKQPTWPKIDLFARSRPDYLSEIERNEAHCLEAMSHWRDPADRSRLLRCRRHGLVDDNPTSG
jgi:hypothetical protein